MSWPPAAPPKAETHLTIMDGLRFGLGFAIAQVIFFVAAWILLGGIIGSLML